MIYIMTLLARTGGRFMVSQIKCAISNTENKEDEKSAALAKVLLQQDRYYLLHRTSGKEWFVGE